MVYKRALGWRIVSIAAIAVCVCACAYLGYVAWSYWSQDQGYTEVAEKATSFEGKAAAEDGGLSAMKVDWDYLRSLNPDVVAWVYMPGTKIDYPVAQADDDSYYLHRDFSDRDGFGGRGGSIFLEAANSPDFSDANNVLFGHHMRDGSMFAALSQQLEDDGEFNAHRTLYVLTPEMNYECTTFALVLTNGSDRIVQTTFNGADTRNAYIADKISRSIVEPDEGYPDPGSLGKLFTLATCDYNERNGRAVLFTSATAQAVPDNALRARRGHAQARGRGGQGRGG